MLAGLGRLTRLGGFALIVLAIVLAVQAAAATNIISASAVADDTFPITANDIKPPECAALNLTSIIAGNGSVTGTNNATLIFGGPGNDRLKGGNGDDCIVGGDGNDELTGNNGNDVLIGGNGNDTLIGKNDDDTLYGGPGSDTFSPDGGFDTCYAGGGVDLQILLSGCESIHP
jgi:Ca2+-binding RTX toxin-like protein